MDNTVYQQKSTVWNCSAGDVRSSTTKKSAQILTPNIYWETPLDHKIYTPSPFPSKNSSDLHQSQEQPLEKWGGHVHLSPPRGSPVSRA